ncbi:MAG TPA: hypothetical protein VJV75_03790 [Candidatus Polarisedimenticolia bacterium]|nr:hypothetical protein [Candidatus Polarisedimenticolia bacterium]
MSRGAAIALALGGVLLIATVALVVVLSKPKQKGPLENLGGVLDGLGVGGFL